MIKTIFFDFGNVIARFDHWRTVLRLARFGELTPEALYAELYDNDLEHAFEHGTLTTSDYVEEAIRRTGLNCSNQEFLDRFLDIFTPNPDVIEAIPALAKSHRLVLASNTNDAHYTHYRRQFAKALSHFSALPASHLAGVRKPAAGFFTYCQKHAEAAPGECAYIDDLAVNVEAGVKHGWVGIHYTPGEDFRAKLAAAGIKV